MPRRLFVLLVCACSSAPQQHASPLPTPTSPPADAAASSPDAAANPDAPGLRLPDGITPLAYELRLEIDPHADAFTGHVKIRVRVDAPTDRVWLHADQIKITAAHWDHGDLAQLPLAGDEMIAFGFGKRVAPGELELAFDYTGLTSRDQEGLFRQRSGTRWYVFSQGESTFARRIVPCFDEPKFKTPWRVTLDVPADQVALANMPETSRKLLDDGRRELEFAPTPAIASYLVAIAVGPFELVDAGTVGRAKVPVRVAALAGGRDRVAVVARRLPRIVDELERYVDDALPWPKLDLVVVPRLFGAMENPGLVTFASRLIAGDARSSAFADEFSRVAAHELAHFWFGDLVTHAWWNDLWLAEAFASWLGDRTALALGVGDSLDAALARRRALEADAQAGALPLRRAVANNADPDDSFDDTEYDKGQSVLATFERWVGEAAFRDAVQAYLRAHRGGVVTAEDFTRALEGVAGADVAHAFAAYVEHAGVPVVDVALDCSGSPKLVASARGGVTIPVCMRVPDADAPICALVGARAELALASCAAWVQPTGGYYVVSWRGTRPADPPRSALSLGQRVALGEDLELAVRRGELPPRDALDELRALAGPELGAAVAAAAIARAIDPLVGDAERAAWQKWLAARFAPRLERKALSEPGELAGDLDDELIALIGADQLPAAVRASAKQRAMRDLARGITPVASVVAAAGGDRAMFDRIAALATRDPSWTAEPLGAFGPAVAPAAVELALGALPSSATMPAITAYFRRPATRAVIWAAVRARLPELLAHVTPPDAADLLDATRSLCDASSRAELVTAFEPHVTRMPEGREHLDRALVVIDACIAARAKAGELGAALH